MGIPTRAGNGTKRTPVMASGPSAWPGQAPHMVS